MTFAELLAKYGEARVIDDYPLWLMEHVREGILHHLSRMMQHITQAYTIWATTKAEADLRRNAQDIAIADCESLKQELELAVDILPVKSERRRETRAPKAQETCPKGKRRRHDARRV